MRARLAVAPDDTVTGEVVVATPTNPKSPNDKGPAVTLPADLAAAVKVDAYRQDGYTGSVLRFARLTFDQTASLTRATFPQSDRTQFALRRAGGRVLVTGAVDLTTVPVDHADFQLKMTFPGRVVDANGEIDGDTVSWTFTPGEVGRHQRHHRLRRPRSALGAELDARAGCGGSARGARRRVGGTPHAQPARQPARPLTPTGGSAPSPSRATSSTVAGERFSV